MGCISSTDRAKLQFDNFDTFNRTESSRLFPAMDSPLFENSDGLNEINTDRTLLRIIDKIALSEPRKLYCIQPVSSDISDGWREISFSLLSHSVNRMAVWIQENVAVSNGPETLAYIGANDIRYVAFILACMRLRHTVRFRTFRIPRYLSDNLLATLAFS